MEKDKKGNITNIYQSNNQPLKFSKVIKANLSTMTRDQMIIHVSYGL